MIKIKKLRQEHQVISSRAQRFPKRCEEKERLMKVADKADFSFESWSYPEGAPEKAGSPLHEWQTSNVLLFSVQSSSCNTKKQWEKSENKEKIFWSGLHQKLEEVKLSKQRHSLSGQNAARNIDMTIEATLGWELSNGTSPKKNSLYLNCQALAKKDSWTQTELDTKSKLRNFFEAKRLWYDWNGPNLSHVLFRPPDKNSPFS